MAGRPRTCAASTAELDRRIFRPWLGEDGAEAGGARWAAFPAAAPAITDRQRAPGSWSSAQASASE